MSNFTITTTVTKTHCTKHRGALPILAVAWNIWDEDTSHLQLWYWKYNIDSGFHQQNGQGHNPGTVQQRRSYEEASKPKAPLDQWRWVDIILLNEVVFESERIQLIVYFRYLRLQSIMKSILLVYK